MSSDESLAKSCPSIVEFQGYYNRRLEEFFDDEPTDAQLANAPPLLNVADPLPPWTFEEFWTTRSKLADYLQRVVPYRPAPPLPDQAGPLPFIIDDTDDRTLRIEVPAFELFDVPLLRRIQQEFVQQHPLWRLVFFEASDETTIVVYPQAIRIAGAPLGADLPAELRKLTARARQLVNQRERTAWRQLAQARQGVAAGVMSLQHNRIALVAVVFGGFRQDPRWLTIYLLIHSSDALRLAAKAPVEIQGSGSYSVDAAGNILSQYGELESFPYALASFQVPSDFRGIFEAYLRDTDAKLTIDLSAVEISRDPELDAAAEDAHREC
ncbi:MAG: hypothetical protein AB7U73_20080 [Pirellulales bacterium]